SRRRTSRRAPGSWSSRRTRMRSGSRRSKSSRRVSSETALPLKQRRADRRRSSGERGALYPRWFWPSFALPGSAYLALFFLFPFYVVLAVTFGSVDPILRQPVPAWNPATWDPAILRFTLSNIVHTDGLYEA